MTRLVTYRIGAGLLCAAFALASCGSVTARDKRVRYDGIAFKTSSKALNKKVSLAEFEVVVKDALRSPKGARQAVHHEATAYCVTNYGNSDVIWTVNPLDQEQELRLDGKDAVYTGACAA